MRLFSFAIISGALIFKLSVAVVIIGSAPPIILAIFSVNLLAPPRCPLKRLITYLPILSITTTAGSLSLLCINGAIDRTAMPVELMNIMASYSVKDFSTIFLKLKFCFFIRFSLSNKYELLFFKEKSLFIIFS